MRGGRLQCRLTSEIGHPWRFRRRRCSHCVVCADASASCVPSPAVRQKRSANNLLRATSISVCPPAHASCRRNMGFRWAAAFSACASFLSVSAPMLLACVDLARPPGAGRVPPATLGRWPACRTAPCDGVWQNGGRCVAAASEPRRKLLPASRGPATAVEPRASPPAPHPNSRKNGHTQLSEFRNSATYRAEFSGFVSSLPNL